MVHYLASFENIRTFLIGHTHYNSVEVYQEGHELVPNEVILDAESHSKYKEHSSIVEKANPVRWYSWLKNKLSRNQEPTNTKFSEIENRRMETGVVEDPDDELVRLKFADSGHNFQRELTHPLVILRLTSVAKLTEQLTKKGKKTAFGFSILSVDDKQEGGKSLINGVTLLRNIDDGKSNFQVVDPGNGSDMVPIDRRDSYNSLETSKNPFNALFNSEAARPMTDPTQKKHE
jgi:hypothetical protein